MGILFGHFRNTVAKSRVTFPLPAQVVRWSLDLLPPYSLLLAPKLFSSYNVHFWKASHAPCIGKLTAKCNLCSFRIPFFSQQPQHFHLNTTPSLFPSETMTSLITLALLTIDPLHKWRLNLNNNTYTSLASHSCENPFVLKHECEATDAQSIVIQI